MAAHPRFGALPDFNFHRVGPAQVLRGHAVQVGHIFKNIFFRRFPFLGKDPAFPAAHGGMGQCAAFCQGYLGFLGQGAKGHVGYVYRMTQDQRLFGIGANHRSGVHVRMFLQRRRVQLCPQQEDIIPSRHGHLRSHRLDNRFSRHRHFMDLCHVTHISILPPVFLRIG